MSRPEIVGEDLLKGGAIAASAALLLPDNSTIGHPGHGMRVRIFFTEVRDANNAFGFSLLFPFGPDIEDRGFGAVHCFSQALGDISLAEYYPIKIKFPGRGIAVTATKVHRNGLAASMRYRRNLVKIEVKLLPGERVQVEGFGLPFAHHGHPCEDWVSGAVPIAGKFTLPDILDQRRFTFITDNSLRGVPEHAQEPFAYPYGTLHTWDYSRYKETLPANKGHQFREVFSFNSDNDHVTSVTQAQVQDIYWLERDVQELKSIRLPAYFVARDGDGPRGMRFWAVVSPGLEVIKRFASAWRRLSKSEFLDVVVYDSWDTKEEDITKKHSIRAKILEYPKGVPALAKHTDAANCPHDLFLKIRLGGDKDRIPMTLPSGRRHAESLFRNCVALLFDAGLTDYQRKVDCACWFLPDSEPQPHQPEDDADVDDLVFRMSLHRNLLRGQGFHETLYPRRDNLADIADQLGGVALSEAEEFGEPGEPGGKGNEKAAVRQVPMVNFLDIGDELYVDVLVNQALPQDRIRFRNYLGQRPLGLGLVSSPAGMGKTTTISAMVVAMMANPAIGRVYGSGPTHVSVDNFAERLYEVGSRVAAQYNAGKADDDPGRARRHLVVRGYRIEDEMDAFVNAVKGDPARAAPEKEWSPQSRWKLGLSVAYWLLAVLGSPKVRPLHPDDHPGLFEMREYVESKTASSSSSDEGLRRLRRAVVGEISFSHYHHEGVTATKDDVRSLLEMIVAQAACVLTTPGGIVRPYYDAWRRARGIAVDEAGCMHRADLYCVWGNTLRPCLLAGDARQLPPTIMEVTATDDQGNALNRFALHGRQSALSFFQAAQWPVYRLKTQLRMCSGMFDPARELVYGDLGGPSYGPDCIASNPKYAPGVDLEAFLERTYPNALRPPANPDSLAVVWVDTRDTVTWIDPLSRSKRNAEQCDMAVALLSDFLSSHSMHVDPSQIAIISPYKLNVEHINGRLGSHPNPRVARVPPAATVDSFQGREADIVFLVMGTTEKSGPGFTSDKQRLNVMITRQRCGLLIFSELEVAGRFGRMGSWIRGQEGRLDRSRALRELATRMYDAGRVLRLRAADLLGN